MESPNWAIIATLDKSCGADVAAAAAAAAREELLVLLMPCNASSP